MNEKCMKRNSQNQVSSVNAQPWEFESQVSSNITIIHLNLAVSTNVPDSTG